MNYKYLPSRWAQERALDEYEKSYKRDMKVVRILAVILFILVGLGINYAVAQGWTIQ